MASKHCQHIITDKRTQETRGCTNARLFGSASKDGQRLELCKRHYALAVYRDWDKEECPAVKPAVAQPEKKPVAPSRPQAPKKQETKTSYFGDSDDDTEQIAKLFDNELSKNDESSPEVDSSLEFDDLGVGEPEPEPEPGTNEEEKTRAMREKELMIFSKGLDIALIVTESMMPSVKGLRNDVKNDNDVQQCLDDIAEEYGEVLGLSDLSPEMRLMACIGLLAAGRWSKNNLKPSDDNNDEPQFDC